MVGLVNSGPSKDPSGSKELELKSAEESKPGAKYLADLARRRDKMAKPDLEPKRATKVMEAKMSTDKGPTSSQAGEEPERAALFKGNRQRSRPVFYSCPWYGGTFTPPPLLYDAFDDPHSRASSAPPLTPAEARIAALLSRVRARSADAAGGRTVPK